MGDTICAFAWTYADVHTDRATQMSALVPVLHGYAYMKKETRFYRLCPLSYLHMSSEILIIECKLLGNDCVSASICW